MGQQSRSGALAAFRNATRLRRDPRWRRVYTDSVYRRLIAICGILVIAFGLWFLWTATIAIMKR